MAPVPTKLKLAHEGRPEFAGWPIAAIRTLRAMSNGDVVDTGEVQRRSETLGERLNYSSARGGVRFLAGGSYWMIDRPVYCTESSGRGRALQQLNEDGMKLAAESLAFYPPREREEVPSHERPPAPITPLWRVLGEGTDYLVVAPTAQRAVALVEGEYKQEVVSKAEPIPTDDELILGWERA